MARQKLVFKNAAELVHIWANQAQDEGCSGIMHFRARHIYSYAMMIASFRSNDIIFLNNRRRSATTSGHQTAVIFAESSDLTVFDYNTIPSWCEGEVARLDGDPCDVEPIEIWEQYRAIWFNLLASASDKRFKRTASQRLALASVYAEKANSIDMRFYLDCYTLSVVDIDTGISEIIAAENSRKERKRIEEFDLCLQERMDWLAGEGCLYPNRHENDIVLRVSPYDAEMVETSMGRFVPLKGCERLYRAFKAATMSDDREVGSYQLDSVSGEGLTIGCSFIKAEELERFAKVLGIAD